MPRRAFPPRSGARAGLGVTAVALLALVGAAAPARAGSDATPRSGPLARQLADWNPYLRVTAASGLDFSRGSFGAPSDSDIWYVPSSLKLEVDDLFVKLTVPYLYIDGDVVPVGGQAEAVPVSIGARGGLGDVFLRAGYLWAPETESWWPAVELSGAVKFPTADPAEGLGTGEYDYGLQVEVFEEFGRFTPFAELGYGFIGDPPGVTLRNKLYASGGVSVEISERISVGAAFDWAQSAVSGRPAIQELSPFASLKLGEHVAVDPYAIVGFSSTSAHWGLGIQLRVYWDNAD